MYNLLKGKKGIIFGALDSNSIAWKTAERVHEEGGEFVLTNAPVAMRMGQINELAEKTGAQVIPADATSLEDLQNLVEKSMEILGGKIDFVLHSIGMSINVRKGKHYTDQNYDWTQKGTDVSAMSFHKLMQSPTPTTAGSGVKGFDGFIAYAEKMSPLGNATALDCANYTVTLFSDLTKRVTLQNLYNDGGFSNMGVSDAVMATFTGEDE